MHNYSFLIILIISTFTVSTTNNVENISSLETCNIPEEFSLIAQNEFSMRYGGKINSPKPVVFRQISMNKYFLYMSQLDSMLNRYGNKYITVTTANTHSYKKQSMKLNDYINLQKITTTTTTTSKWGK